MSDEPKYTEFEKGEREALLQVRGFIAKHGIKEVDDFCWQRLHDIQMDARHHQRPPRNVVKRGPHGPLVYPE